MCGAVQYCEVIQEFGFITSTPNKQVVHCLTDNAQLF